MRSSDVGEAPPRRLGSLVSSRYPATPEVKPLPREHPDRHCCGGGWPFGQAARHPRIEPTNGLDAGPARVDADHP